MLYSENKTSYTCINCNNNMPSTFYNNIDSKEKQYTTQQVHGGATEETTLFCHRRGQNRQNRKLL